MQTLLLLLRLRMVVLNQCMLLQGYRPTRERTSEFAVAGLIPIVADARKKLAEALGTRFFSRCTDTAKRLNCSFVFETQLFHQPQFKNIDVTLAKKVRSSCIH